MYTEEFMRTITAVILAVVLSAGIIHAAGDYGTAGEFLDWGAGARSEGLGRAFTGLADDASAIYYNPAGLALQNPLQITAQHVFLFADTFYDFGAITYPLSGIGTFALGYIRLSSNNFDGRDAQWYPTGSFNIAQQAAILSYAREVTGWLSFGLNLKFINEDIPPVNVNGYGADLGLMFTPSDYISFGLCVLNVVPVNIKMVDKAESFPVTIKFGTALKLFGDRVIPVLDVVQELAGKDLKFRMGIELYPIQQAAVRAGLDETELTFGAGFYLKPYRVDYSLSHQELGFTHRISLTFAFGGFDINLSADPKIFSPVGTRKSTTISIYAVTKYPISEWELNVANEDGDVVRSWSGDEKPPQYITWDGKDDRGLPVSDGEYKCVMKVKDKNGRDVESGKETVKISSSIPSQPGSIQLEE
jgi:hypothetical protein